MLCTVQLSLRAHVPQVRQDAKLEAPEARAEMRNIA